ncbi:MAG TPA: zinc ribbon domain-containing protein [Methanomassiliicoccales archaeon]|nr:zinc ribbon domain-containing protein [Methanomassiliicoccales archaeon]
MGMTNPFIAQLMVLNIEMDDFFGTVKGAVGLDRMDWFGGRKVDKAADEKRIREIQALIIEFAGDVDDTSAEMVKIKEMMKSNEAKREELRKAQAAKEEKKTLEKGEKPAPGVPPPEKKDRFCIKCGTRLPDDAKDCLICKGREDEEQKAFPIQPPPVPPVLVPHQDRYCIRCGSKLPEDGTGYRTFRRKIDLSIPPRPQEPGPVGVPQHRSIYCIRCGSKLPFEGAECIKCKKSNKICPSCGSIVQSSARVCPVCIRVLPVDPSQKN